MEKRLVNKGNDRLESKIDVQVRERVAEDKWRNIASKVVLEGVRGEFGLGGARGV